MKLTRLVIATTNRGKLEEVRTGLALPGVTIYSLQDFPAVPDAPETGIDFVSIALAKASYYFEHLQLPVLAEDSGLVIPCLDGFPGIYSARVAADDPGRIREVLHRMAGKAAIQRDAWYVCSMVFSDGITTLAAEGRCEGRIEDSPRGSGGFGYDPIFVPEGQNRTFAMMDPIEKAQYSHRGRAIRRLLPQLLAFTKDG